MNCVIMKCGNLKDYGKIKNNIVNSTGNELNKYVETTVNKLKKLVNQNNGAKVKIYCPDTFESFIINDMLLPELEKNKLAFEQDVFIRSGLNARSHGLLDEHNEIFVGKKPSKFKVKINKFLANLNLNNVFNIEKKNDYENRVFDSIYQILLETDPKDIVVLMLEDEVIKTCQNNNDIHSMFYFGDEFLFDQSLFRGGNVFGMSGIYSGDLITSEQLSLIYNDSLGSKKEFPLYGLENVVLEAPKVLSSGSILPVYEKYARNKLDEQKKVDESTISKI